jgi:hypothetical protein
MRAILRSCLVWFVGYPSSVLVATTVLMAAVWLPEVRMSAVSDDLWLLVRRIIIAAPVVAAFSLLPAALTKPSNRVLPYVASGARTGAWCGVLVTSAFYVVLVSAAGQQTYRWLMSGDLADNAPSVLFGSAVFLTAAVGVFAVAGAAGGLVFGLFAAGAHSSK